MEVSLWYGFCQRLDFYSRVRVMIMWVKWECFSVKGTDRFLVGNGVRRWELLLMAELSASKRKKEIERWRERVREKMGWLRKQAILENFQWRSFFLLALLLTLNSFAFSLLWLLREDAMNWYCCICETASVCIWFTHYCEGNTVRNYFLLVGFIFINFIGFFSMWILGSIWFLYWEEVRVQTVVRAWGLWCHVIRFGRYTQDGDHVTVIKMTGGDTD